MQYHSVRIFILALLAAVNAVAVPLDLAPSDIGFGIPRERYSRPSED